MAQTEVSERLKDILTQIALKSERRYKDEHVEERMQLVTRYYDSSYGQFAGTSEPNPLAVNVNKVFPRVRTAMAGLYAKRPEIIAKPRRAQDSDAAKTAELLLNYLTRHAKLSRELRECLFWSRLGMYGCVKLGMDDRFGMRIPIFRSFDPRAVRVDTSPDTFRPEEGCWQKFRFRRSFEALQESGLYPEPLLNKLGDRLMKDGKDSGQAETTDVWLWEHYYQDDKKIVLATEVAGPAALVGGEASPRMSWTMSEHEWIREEEFTNVVGLPGRFLFFVPSPRRWYPISPIEQWIEQQKEVNAFRSQKLIAAERSNAKMLYDLSKFTDTEREKLEDPNPQAHIGVNGNPADVMAPIPYGQVSPDIYRGELEAEQSIQEIDGSGGAQLGIEAPQTGSTSATRDAIVENNMRLRQSDNQEIWEEFLEDVYQGVLNLAQGHMKGSMILAITGTMERELSRQNIQGDLEVTLSFGSTLPTDREKEWERAKDIYTLTLQDPLINAQWRIRQLLQAEGDIKNIEQAVNPPPSAAMPWAQPGGPPGGLPGLGAPPGGGMTPPLPTPAGNQMGTLMRLLGGASPLSSAASFRAESR